MSKISEIFDIWPAFSSRNLSLLDVPAAVFDVCGGRFLCPQTAVFSGYFFLKICARNNAVKKKTVLRAFIAILSLFMSIRCDAEAGYAICLCVWGTNL